METLIKQALKALGLDEGLWTEIKVASSSEIETAVKNLATEQRTEKIKKALKDAKINEDDLDKYTNSISDRRVTEALKTHDEKLKAGQDDEAERQRLAKEKADKEAEEKKKADELAKLDGRDKENAELKQMIIDQGGQIKTLTASFTDLKSGINTSSRDSIVAKAIKDAGLTTDWEKYITADEPEAIATQIEGLKVVRTTQQQVENDQLIADGGIPAQGAKGKTFVDDKIADFAKKQDVDSTEVVGLASQQITT